MTGARVSVWLTTTVGVLMVWSRSDRSGYRLKATGEVFEDLDGARRAGWALIGSSQPIEDWRVAGDWRRAHG